jgi:hypothetical protein
MSDNDRRLFDPSGRQLAKIVGLLVLIALTPLAARYTPHRQQAAAYESCAGQSKANVPNCRITPSSEESVKHSKNPKESGPGLGTWPDWVLVFFTLALVCVAFLQHGLEAKLARDSAATAQIAKDASDAAKTSADTAKRQLDLQRLVQRGQLDLIGSGAMLTKAAQGQTALNGALNVRNAGSSVITIERIVGKWRFHAVLEDQPSDLAAAVNELGWLLAPQGQTALPSPEIIMANPYDAALPALFRGEFGLWYYGAITYTDEVAGKRVFRFCHRYDFKADHSQGVNVAAGWVHAGGPAYWGEDKVEAEA